MIWQLLLQAELQKLLLLLFVSLMLQIELLIAPLTVAVFLVDSTVALLADLTVVFRADLLAVFLVAGILAPLIDLTVIDLKID